MNSLRLSFYVGRKLLLYFCLTLYACLLLIFFVDLAELVRRSDGNELVSWGLLLGIGLLRLPLLVEKLLPMILLLGVLLACGQFARSRELIAMRALGVSAWQFLAPILLFAFVLGLASVLLYNPLASVLASRAEPLEHRYITQSAGTLAISSTGLWLRQAGDGSGEGESGGHATLHARHAGEQADGGLRLLMVSILLHDEGDRFLQRLDAEEADLHEGYWALKKVWFAAPGRAPRFQESHRLATSLTPEQIRESLADPDTISFWELPNFIEHTSAAGLSTTRYRTHYQSLLALPFFLCALMLPAVALVFRFALGHIHSHAHGAALLAAALSGGALYFVHDFLLQLGASGILPIPLAVWASTAVAVGLSGAALLRMENPLPDNSSNNSSNFLSNRETP